MGLKAQKNIMSTRIEELKKQNNSLQLRNGRMEGMRDSTLEALRNENRNLMEIIRWNIKPDIAKDPFNNSMNTDEDRSDMRNQKINLILIFKKN